MCGENYMTWLSLERLTGSPPRVRGKRRRATGSRARSGITPACAGKTEQYIGEALPDEDHPRVCGENDTLHDGTSREKGSPPRVRGKPYRR